VLDLPCGAGRLWPVLQRSNVRRLIGADNSQAMLALARETASAIEQPVEIHRASAFGTQLPDGCASLVICMRFYHHLAQQNDRQRVLEELKRLSSRYVLLSLWVDGNFAGNRRMRKQEPAAARSGFRGRRCQRREDAEREFRQAGFSIVRHYDVWPKLQMTRIYLLER
jgi:SAM-dependent methyltransferase